MSDWRTIDSAPKDGTVKRRGQRIIPYDERIKSNSIVDAETGCWLWQGTVRSEEKPYGRLIIGSRTDGSRRSIGAHQLSYLTFKGQIPEGMCVCHECDNPRCVNPDHLWLGTKKDNADDRDRKGRNKKAPIYYGSDAPWSKLTAEQVDAIRGSNLSSRQLAALLGISDSHVRAIRRGEHHPPPPGSDRPAAPEIEPLSDGVILEIKGAIKATEYKYFGDYELSDEQQTAVNVLIAAAEMLIARATLSQQANEERG